MTKKRLGILAITLLSAGLARAAEGTPIASAAPAPFYKDPTTGMEMVFVKGGCYPMGDLFSDGEFSNEGSVHEVCVDDFYIGKHEVTRGQWKTVTGSDPSSTLTCSDDACPVDHMSWSDAQAFISRLNGRSGGTPYRLPTEAEWEFAARSGGRSERYSGGNDVESVAWYRTTTGYDLDPARVPVAHPVGTKAPNGLGIHDMSGNVWEFTSDWYGETYAPESPRNNPTGPAAGDAHVKRGGCGHGRPGNSRTSRRNKGDGPGNLVGLRLLRIP